VKAERLPLVHDPPGPIHMLFHQDVGSPDRLVNLIQSTLIGNREVLAQAAGRLEAQDAVQLPVGRTGTMQIRGLRGTYRKTPVVDRQIAFQKLIRRLQRGNVREPHLLDHPILKGIKEPLHPPLRLGGVGRD
jgi:hypothetical protein